MKYLFLLFLASFIALSCTKEKREDSVCTTLNKTSFNQLHNGKKEGIWLESDNYTYSFVPYTNGRLNGFKKIYDGKTQKLLSLVRYSDGKEIGPCFYFNDNGQLSFVQDSISVNTKFIEQAKAMGFMGKTYQSYVIMFSQDGTKVKEGWCIYEDDIESNGEEVGEWIEYDTRNLQ